MKRLVIGWEIKLIIFTVTLSGILIKNLKMLLFLSSSFSTWLSHRKKWVSNVFSWGWNHAQTAKTQRSNERRAEDGVRGTMTHRVSSYTSQHCSD